MLNLGFSVLSSENGCHLICTVYVYMVMCMHVCTVMYVFYVHMYVCMHVCMYVRMYACMYVCVCMNVDAQPKF